MTEVDLNMTEFVSHLAGCVLFMNGYVLNIIGYVINSTLFVNRLEKKELHELRGVKFFLRFSIKLVHFFRQFWILECANKKSFEKCHLHSL